MFSVFLSAWFTANCTNKIALMNQFIIIKQEQFARQSCINFLSILFLQYFSFSDSYQVQQYSTYTHTPYPCNWYPIEHLLECCAINIGYPLKISTITLPRKKSRLFIILLTISCMDNFCCRSTYLVQEHITLFHLVQLEHQQNVVTGQHLN